MLPTSPRDKLGNPICKGALVAVAQEDHYLNYGYVEEYNKKTKEIKIKGGGIKRGIWRSPSQTIVVFMPFKEKENDQ